MDKDNTDINIILAQWKTCIEMANSVSQRRDLMNGLFITLHTAIITLIFKNFSNENIVAAIVGVVLCWIWKRFILNFRLLNQGKFKIINELEKLLPWQPFTKEWEYLKNNTKYEDGTNLERWLPRVFIIIYILIILSVIVISFLNNKITGVI